MKKTVYKWTFTIIGYCLLLVCLNRASAQSAGTTYDFDLIRQDSFFMVETVRSAPTKDVPRPATTVAAQLFRSKGQVVDFVAYLRKSADESAEKAKEFEKAAKEAEAKAKELLAAQGRLADAAKHIEAALERSAPFFEEKAKQ